MSLISLPVKIGSLMLWLTYLDQSNCILNAVIICCFTTMLFISSVFITRQTVCNKFWKDHLRSAETSCSMSSVPSALCVWQEGKQAALAADFSVTQFKHLGRLLMVHGRNSYKRSAALSQFVIHRSLCISAMQVQHNTKSVFVSSWKFDRHSFYRNRTKLQILTTQMFFRPEIFAYHQRAMVFIVTDIFTFCNISNANNPFSFTFWDFCIYLTTIIFYIIACIAPQKWQTHLQTCVPAFTIKYWHANVNKVRCRGLITWF